MGESMIIRRGGTGGGEPRPVGWELKTDIITESMSISVPKSKNQEFTVRLFGGGGGYGYSKYSSGSKIAFNIHTGGGGGYMNNGTFTLNEGEIIHIRIGEGGGYDDTNGTGFAGGITSFGSYLSANGGEAGSTTKGGNGGSGGGGGNWRIQSDYRNTNGGIGFQFGGGGGYKGGNGGIWGGGGGSVNSSHSTIGGIYGGNNGKNGYNTIGENIDFTGYGLTRRPESSTTYYQYGGGGYGGNGGYNSSSGGGGYGGNGGSGVIKYVYSSIYEDSIVMDAGGGGGGYGGSGGSGSAWNYYSPNTYFYTSVECGGGGGYGPAGYGHGGGYFITGEVEEANNKILNGKNGICIIQYMAPVYANNQ